MSLTNMDIAIDIVDIIQCPVDDWENTIYLYNRSRLSIEDITDMLLVDTSAQIVDLELTGEVTFMQKANNIYFDGDFITNMWLNPLNEGDRYYSVMIEFKNTNSTWKGPYSYVIRFDCSYFSLNESFHFLYNNVILILMNYGYGF